MATGVAYDERSARWATDCAKLLNSQRESTMHHFNRPDGRIHCHHGVQGVNALVIVYGALGDHTDWRLETALDIIDLQSATVTVFVGP